MTFTIRLARPEDALCLARMNTAFNGDTGVTADDISRSLLTSPETVVIAEADGSPAGFCCAQLHHSFCYPSPVAEVTEMYVVPEFRRMGCAQAMLRHLEALLQEKFGADEMHLLTGTRNLAAQSAYRKAGFLQKNEVYMVKEVSVKR